MIGITDTRQRATCSRIQNAVYKAFPLQVLSSYVRLTAESVTLTFSFRDSPDEPPVRLHYNGASWRMGALLTPPRYWTERRFRSLPKILAHIAEVRACDEASDSCGVCGEDGGTSCGIPNCGLLA